MKTGYSLLLMEHVDAGGVGYEDCRAFQIVCPECKEPVFKVAREYVAKTSHFFSLQ